MKGLSNPNLKVRRAKEHLDSLQREIESFFKTDFYKITTEDDLETGEHVFTVEFEPPPIWPLGAILGDFISCLRASLDHLVFGLAYLGGRSHNNTCFPIIGEYSSKTEAFIMNATLGLPNEAISIVKLFQPYNAGSAYKAHHLWRLNYLWNIDKHRRIPLHSGFIQLNFPVLPHHFVREMKLINDKGVMRFPLAAKPYLHFQPKADVQFGDDKEQVILKIRDLVEIYEFVSNRVIPSFTRFFPE